MAGKNPEQLTFKTLKTAKKCCFGAFNTFFFGPVRSFLAHVKNIFLGKNILVMCLRSQTKHYGRSKPNSCPLKHLKQLKIAVLGHFRLFFGPVRHANIVFHQNLCIQLLFRPSQTICHIQQRYSLYPPNNSQCAVRMLGDEADLKCYK